MSPMKRQQGANPRLGSYYSIVAGAFVSLVLTLLILEQLDIAGDILRLAMLGGTLGMVAFLGFTVFSLTLPDFFVTGRRAPAFFNGLVLGVTALGGVGTVVLTGLLFVNGFDALCLVIGWMAGLVAMVVLIAPYFRKSGAYTLPSFIARRFDSPLLRVVAAALLAVPLLLLVAAELRIGAFMASWLLGGTEQTAMLLILVAIALPLAGGGMRTLTWSSAAKSVIMLIALLAPVTVLAAFLTNLPLPQMSHGPALRALGRQEAWQAFPLVTALPLGFDLAKPGLEHITQRFATPFASVGVWAFALFSFSFMAGIAGSPSLLLRAGTTPTVYGARKSLGWAAVIVGISVITMSAIAVFMRDMLMDQVVGAPRDSLPSWFAELMQMGLAGLGGTGGNGATVTAADVTLKRDAVLMSLPIAAGFPAVAVYLAVVGGLVAAMTAAASALFSMGASLSEDIVLGYQKDDASDFLRLTMARIAILAVAFIGGWAAMETQSDPLRLFLWSVGISGSTAFPVLVLSIWWKRLNKWGALAAMLAGFTVSAGFILQSEAGNIGINSALAGVFGLPAAVIAGFAVSLATPLSPRLVHEFIRDVRVPSGETVYDRDRRLAGLRRRAKQQAGVTEGR